MSLAHQDFPCLRDGWRAPKLAYLSDAQNDRLEHIRRRRLLWKGHHRRFFLDEGRTQFNFQKLRAQGQVLVPYKSVNLLRLISTTFADLLLGKDPKLSSGDPDQQDVIDALNKRSDVGRVAYDAVVSASWSAEAMVEVSRWDGQVYVANLRPDEMFPVGDRNADGQYSTYVRYAVAPSAADASRQLLLETTYSAGLITRACYEIDREGRKGKAVGLDRWPVTRPDGTPLPENEPTGVDVPTIVWLGNELDEGEPVSDYAQDLVECQDHLNHAETQLAVVIAKHADPKMYVPASMVNPATGGIETGQGVYFVRSKDEVPGYVTWNAELAAAMENRDTCTRTMAMLSELTPGLLGIDKGAVPESAEKLRLAATKALARVTRKAKYVGPFLRTLLDTARALEAGSKFVVVEQSPSAVEFRDPLPVDWLAKAQAASTWRSAGLMSVEDGVAERLEDPAAAAAEVERVKAEAAAAAPATFGGLGLSGQEPGETDAGPEAPAAGGQQQQQQQRGEGQVAA